LTYKCSAQPSEVVTCDREKVRGAGGLVRDSSIVKKTILNFK
jgi:hypothetical protein